MATLIDSIDYIADNLVVAPQSEWRIFGEAIARVTKKVPRYCPPNCAEYKMDSDKYCIRAYECNSYVFDTHLVKSGEKLYEVLFASNFFDPSEGFMWRVGANYLVSILGEKQVKRMLKQYYRMKEDSEQQEFIISMEVSNDG